MRRSYLLVLGSAICCYASLGAVVRIVSGYVGGSLHESTRVVGLAIGAPALTAIVTRPLGGRLADARGTRPVVVGGGLLMALVSGVMLAHGLAPFVLSRLAVGIGEGAMMSATVLWLLRLAGPERRGRALGHIGLANYAGLTAGPLLADALGGARHPDRIFVLAAVLPLVPLVTLHLARPGEIPPAALRGGRDSTARLARVILLPGIGLLLVNVGYAALLSFGPQALRGAAVFVLPAYALTVIAVRTFAAGLPDRLGGRTTLTFAAPVAAAGLLAVAFAPTNLLGLGGVVVLGIGQGFAVPALGLLGLAAIAPAQQGAAAGMFFAWFDAGVGLGGPLAGVAAGAGGPDAALAVAAGAVVCATLVRWPRRLTRPGPLPRTEDT
jgi:MFS family permease